MERQGLGWTAWLQFFKSTGLLSHNLHKFTEIGKKGRRRKRDRERKNKGIKVETEMNMSTQESGIEKD